MSEQEEKDELYVHHRFVADAGQGPLRVDKFLTNFLFDTSRSRIQKAAEARLFMSMAIPSRAITKSRQEIPLRWY